MKRGQLRSMFAESEREWGRKKFQGIRVVRLFRGEQCGGENAGADQERRRDCQPVSAHSATAPKMSQEQLDPFVSDPKWAGP